AGFDEFRWPRPVRPGDELRVESEVLEVRASKSRPDRGVIKVKTTTLNQNNEPVQLFVGSLIVLRRPAPSGETTGARGLSRPRRAFERIEGGERSISG
ncbi:MAG: FAS1-like dehydratase domain-containing protein, partial [Gemmatimonadaceae bacterium]